MTWNALLGQPLLFIFCLWHHKYDYGWNFRITQNRFQMNFNLHCLKSDVCRIVQCFSTFCILYWQHSQLFAALTFSRSPLLCLSETLPVFLYPCWNLLLTPRHYTLSTPHWWWYWDSWHEFYLFISFFWRSVNRHILSNHEGKPVPIKTFTILVILVIIFPPQLKLLFYFIFFSEVDMTFKWIDVYKVAVVIFQDKCLTLSKKRGLTRHVFSPHTFLYY